MPTPQNGLELPDCRANARQPRCAAPPLTSMPMMRRLVSLFRPRRVFAAIRDLFVSLFRDGVRVTWQRIRSRLRNRAEDPRTLYENHRRAQYEYVRAYARAPLKQRRTMLEDLLRAEQGYRGIV